MKLRRLAAVLAACLVAVTLWAQTTPSPALLVLNKSARTLAIVNPATLKVVAKIPVGHNPHEVVASTDGKTAYVSNYGFGAYHTITVVDLLSRKVRRVINLAPLRGPHGLAFAGGELYFTAEINKAIGRYNPATGKVDWIMGTGQDRTHMIAVSPDLNHIFTANVNSGTISIFAKTAKLPPHVSPAAGPNWEETVIRTGPGTEGFGVSPDGSQLWAVARESGAISIINVATEKLVETLPDHVPGGRRVAFTPNGKYVLIAYMGGGNKGGVAVFGAATRRKIKNVNLGCGAGRVLMEPGGRRAFVSCSSSDYVAVIGLRKFEETGRVVAGEGPDGLAWAVRK